VMTAAARKFVSPAALEALTHRPVIRGFWPEQADGAAPHIQLATWADLVVLYPATAATIARVAQAACTDVLSALVTATTQPVLVVPSMNESMHRSPGVQRNLEQLRRDGRHVVEPVMGLEAAVAPSARAPMAGAAPPPGQVVAAIEMLVERVPVAPVVGADAWDRQYESSPVGDLPWFTEQLDADVVRELEKVKKGRLLDVGTGPGTAAIFAARNGFDVVATDVSSTALGIARRRANGERVAWVLDDFLDSRLWGRFDVLVDRGCLHCLPKISWPDYARSAGRLVEAGGTLVLKVHAPEEAGHHGTHPAGPDELRALFGEWFTLVGTHASQFDGTIRPSPKALLAVMTRRSPGL
ncbi:MAG TPA: flavoprotein, partial [Polyangiaceae bacterium]